MDIHDFIYINEPEIERLYAQSSKRVISERLQTDRRVLKGGASAKVMGAGVDVGGGKETNVLKKKK